MLTTPAMAIKEASATEVRENFRHYAATARGGRVVLITNKQQAAKYLVDKEWLDNLVRERESVLATLEVLADRELTERLLKTAETIDEDLRAGRLRTMAEVFGE